MIIKDLQNLHNIFYKVESVIVHHFISLLSFTTLSKDKYSSVQTDNSMLAIFVSFLSAICVLFISYLAFICLLFVSCLSVVWMLFECCLTAIASKTTNESCTAAFRPSPFFLPQFYE